MEKQIKKEISERFLKVVSALIATEKVKSIMDFAKKTGLSYHQLMDVKYCLAGAEKVSYVNTYAIHKMIVAFPDVSANYIFSGIGNVFLASTEQKTNFLDIIEQKYHEIKGLQIEIKKMKKLQLQNT